MEPPPYVTRADDDVIVVKGADEDSTPTLVELGFEPEADTLVREVDGDEEKAEVFAALRDAGICFSWGREWNPVEVFQWLCEQGLLAGPVRTIGWRGPGEFEVRELG